MWPPTMVVVRQRSPKVIARTMPSVSHSTSSSSIITYVERPALRPSYCARAKPPEPPMLPCSMIRSRPPSDFSAAGKNSRVDDLVLALLHDHDLVGAHFRGSAMQQVSMRGVELVDVDISGEVVNLTINGIEVGTFVEAELDRRSPDRAKMRPTDPDGFRTAWDVVERLWAQTADRARRLDPDLLHRSVDEEWSYIETLRHLVFATDSWLRRAILGDPAPWHELDLPWDNTGRTPGCRATAMSGPRSTRCSSCSTVPDGRGTRLSERV